MDLTLLEWVWVIGMWLMAAAGGLIAVVYSPDEGHKK